MLALMYAYLAQGNEWANTPTAYVRVTSSRQQSSEFHNLGKKGVHKVLNFAQQNSPFYMFGHNITFFLIDL